jgi:hypothetical protein
MPADNAEKTGDKTPVFVFSLALCGIMYAGELFLSPLLFASHQLRLWRYT